MAGEREESDQLPEEAPADQVTDDDGDGEDAGRQDVKHTPGVPGEDKRGTGQPQDHD